METNRCFDITGGWMQINVTALVILHQINAKTVWEVDIRPSLPNLTYLTGKYCPRRRWRWRIRGRRTEGWLEDTIYCSAGWSRWRPSESAGSYRSPVFLPPARSPLLHLRVRRRIQTYEYLMAPAVAVSMCWNREPDKGWESSYSSRRIDGLQGPPKEDCCSSTPFHTAAILCENLKPGELHYKNK